MAVDEAMAKLTSSIKELALSEKAEQALLMFAQDPHGIERDAAASIVASSLDIPLDEANRVILEIFGKHLFVENNGNPPHVLANYHKLGIGDQARALLVQRRIPFENHGAPHSGRSMGGLVDFFDESMNKIYVGLEVTDPIIFSRLQDRAEAGRKTIFLIPRRRDLPTSKQRHYREILWSWVTTIREGPPSLKRNVEIRVTDIPFKDLYTSALTKERARFDIRFLNSSTTRDGSIIEVNSETSLYLAIQQRYQEALRRSYPLWRLWWYKAAYHWLRRLAFPVILVVIGFFLASYANNNPYAAVGSAFAIGLLVNMASQWVRIDKWMHPELFRNP